MPRAPLARTCPNAITVNNCQFRNNIFRPVSVPAGTGFTVAQNPSPIEIIVLFMRRSVSLKLRDGRTLAWRQYGAADGFPVLFFHGNLNSRLFEPAWEKTQAQTEAARARLIAVDRPGYGASSPLRGRTYASWAADVEQLAAHLALPAYAVLGYSSGGPNALVCAATAPAPTAAASPPPRLAACGLVSPDGPYLAIGGAPLVEKIFGGGAAAETAAAVVAAGEGEGEGLLTVARMEARAAANAAEMRASYEALGAKPGKGARAAMALADIDAATAQGVFAAAQDSVLEGSDWGFALGAAARVPTLLWHGEDDADVPVAAGRYVCDGIEGCEGTFIAGENHTLIRRHWQSILERLIAAATQEEERWQQQRVGKL
jgi:pimeloyl-ACP methyl ester carboxylesterase